MTMSASLPGVSVPTLSSRLASARPRWWRIRARRGRSAAAAGSARHCARAAAVEPLQRERRAHDRERILRHRDVDIGAESTAGSRGRAPPGSAACRVPSPSRSAAHSETWPPVSLISRQASSLRCVQWMYSSPGRISPARPSAISVRSVLLLTPMRDGAHADFARDGEQPPVEAAAKRERQQLVLGVEIGLPQPHDVLRILRAGPVPRE